MAFDPTHLSSTANPAGAANPAAASQSVGELFFVGNATVLLKYGPFTLLTDPNFLHRGQRAYLGHGLTSRRLTDPALRIDQLPPLDAVVLSHLHGDHWDRVARRNLDSGLPIVTTPHASRRLQGLHGFRRAVGLRTWEQHSMTKGGAVLRITSTPGRHAPGPVRYLLPPVMGSVLELATADGEVRHRLYITGDTLMYPALEEIARRFPDTDLALLHLGGTTLPGGMVVTMDGRQGAELLATMSPRRAVPIHYDDYDVMRSPLSDFRTEVERRGLADRVSYVGRGESLAL
ncbi:MBL fold metallo-hydrolase [Actinopolymorpha sp. NPDC004070]|uniref:MBL fold metallo-hydrolase n=1 Tax=Actinopolymorpha sp. NPDC004070 TaxID=3154548 RepID=UPI00339FD675